MGISTDPIYSSSNFEPPNQQRNGFSDMGRFGSGNQVIGYGWAAQLRRVLPGGAAEEGGEIDKGFRRGGGWENVEYGGVSEGDEIYGELQGERWVPAECSKGEMGYREF